ncbi:NAD(P)H-binding protein [Herbaspirillum autotrophicum]|uniref:NAD(P)H-binding protein n=1 Tax=Herbaspirillum autotrophicum TaxID=180195 RepID=UPI00067AFE31|nr:NAD(P)H-binding protein [Herbaspirillum autotrophicum]
MKILLFGATGMVGQGVLRECLAAADVTQVTTVGRTRVTQEHPKLRQIVHANLTDLQSVEDQLQGCDACFFCLGVSSAGMNEDTYRRLTYDLTLSIAGVLARLNPQMKFTYVSGAGTDSTEQGRSMWARVKGKTENDLQKLPLASVQLFRPGVIQPLHGIRSKTRVYQFIYNVIGPLLTLLRQFFPNAIVTTEDLGNAMLNGARSLTGPVIVEAADIVRLARQPVKA